MTGPIITLLSDFGTSDGYAAAMKGVILDVVPNAILVDAAHDIRAHDIQAASWALAQYAFTFPEGTTHIAVVDPDTIFLRHMWHPELPERPVNSQSPWIVQYLY